MNKEQYLMQLKQSARQGEEGKQKISGKALAKQIVILSLAAIIFSGIGTIMTNYSREKEYSAGGIPSYENMGYKDSFKRINVIPLGNDINCLLNGGNVLIWDNVRAVGLPKMNGNEFLTLGNVSYINKVGNTLIFRDDGDRHIYQFDLSTKNKDMLFPGNAGEIFCVGHEIYFQDLENNNIKSINTESKEDVAVALDKPLIAFAVVNDTIIGLTSDNQLGYGKIGSTNKPLTSLANNINRFFINGNIIAQSGQDILSFNSLGEKAKKVYHSDDQAMLLIGVAEDDIFIQEEGQLIQIKDGNKKVLVNDPHKLYRSLKVTQNEIVVLALDPQDTTIKKQLLVMKEGPENG